MAEKRFCNSCDLEGWEGSDGVTPEQFLDALSESSIVPTGDGKVVRTIGSPFRVPLPLQIRLCCLDSQIADAKEVDYSCSSKTEVERSINLARNAVYVAVGLPGIPGAE